MISLVNFCLLMSVVTSCNSSDAITNEVLPGQDSVKTVADTATVTQYDGYKLVWHDEFNVNGKPSSDWNYETGFVRNEELQWYTKENVNVTNGNLVIEGRSETVNNPNYVSGSSNWKTNRQKAYFTSSSINTRASFTFKYGRVEVRAKIPTAKGSWPAIWELGNKWSWPNCGEIDMMEYYLKDGVPSVLANACWGSSEAYTAIWDEVHTPLTHFVNKDKEWVNKFHVWRMDWDRERILLYLDGELLNSIDLSQTKNRGYGGIFDNPFSNDIQGFGDYILLNLAIGGNGGTPDKSQFPLRYYIDYVRVYQK